MSNYIALLVLALMAVFATVSCSENREDPSALDRRNPMPARRQVYSSTGTSSIIQLLNQLQGLSGSDGLGINLGGSAGIQGFPGGFPNPPSTRPPAKDQLGNFVVQLLNAIGNLLNGGPNGNGLISSVINILRGLLGGLLGLNNNAGGGGGLLGGLLGGDGGSGGLLGGLLG